VTVSFLELFEGGGVCGQWSDSEIGTARAFPVLIEPEPRLLTFVLTRFLHANRYPPSDRVRGHVSLENAIADFGSFSMSSTDGETGMRNLTDKATYERLEKDVAAVKNDITALTEQITDAINSFAGTARKQARRGYKQARTNVDSAVDDLSERGSAVMGAAQDAAMSIEETLEDVIAERPLATVGLALGLGFLIGLTWRR
jgi:ElaB/YqjD/DUF883 family membrane-anchored ribosome-binding protein